MKISTLAIVFCTRNRPRDLMRAVTSVCIQASDIQSTKVELVIIDDGAIQSSDRRDLKAMAERAKWDFRYVNKSSTPGLYRSRITGVSSAQSEILLFLDDDVEVEPGYLKGLLATYEADPRLVGVGGVDVLGRRAGLGRRIYEYLIGFRSFVLGELSLTGFGGGMDEWLHQPGRFRSQYLYGCNMSFKRSILTGLPDAEVFDGHATGEDLYLSYWASRSGELSVDPRLRVRHYQAPTARDRMEQIFYRQIFNHYYLLIATGSPLYKRVIFVYTATGLIALSGAKCLIEVLRNGSAKSLPRVRGGIRGLLAVLRSFSAEASEGN